jgi:hypothetical protein
VSEKKNVCSASVDLADGLDGNVDLLARMNERQRDAVVRIGAAINHGQGRFSAIH